MKLRYNDDEHAYWLDGKRCKSVTTVAKIPDDLYRLQLWDKRQVAIGLAQRPDLVEAVAAHIEDDDVVNGLCEKAKEHAGANRGSRRGTAAHRLTESHDLGHTVIPTALATSVLAAWEEVLAAAGLEIVPELMERIVIYPEHRLCGKFDRIARTRKGRLVILDLKSGARAIDYPHAAAVQLALYANAPLMAGPLNGRGETHEFEPLPDVDKRFGVLIHLPEDGEARAVKLDIAEGWKTAKDICFPTLRWRSMRKDQLVQPLATVAVAPAWVTPDEGQPMSEVLLQELRDAVKRHPNKIVLDVWLKQSIDAGRSFHPTPPHGVSSWRRYEIIRAALAWCDHEDDTVRAAFNLLLGEDEELQPTMSTGGAFGTLSIEEAQRLCDLASSLDSGAVSLSFSDDGTPVMA